MNMIRKVCLEKNHERFEYLLDRPLPKDLILTQLVEAHPSVLEFNEFVSAEGTLYLTIKSTRRSRPLPRDVYGMHTIEDMRKEMGFSKGQKKEKKEHSLLQTHHTFVGGKGNNEIDWKLQQAQSALDNRAQKRRYPHIVIGKYAEKGNYQHLVGKRCKIVDSDDLLEIHLIQVMDDEKTYLIRKSDIKP